MRGPWSRKTPHRVTITPVEGEQSVQELGKAKRVTIKPVSEKSTAKGA